MPILKLNFNQRYAKDSNRAGTESDYGRQLSIGRVPPSDQVLYQTERYHTNTFGYDIPVREDGWYLLVLKFSEVYFGAPNMKVCNRTASDACQRIQSKIFTDLGETVKLFSPSTTGI